MRLADWTGSALTVVAGGGLLLYGARGALGAAVAVDWLAQHGAPATISIQRLDADGFTGAVSVGPPENPDFVADRVEASFAPSLRLRALRLVRPRVQLALGADGKLRFGALQPFADEALRAKPSGGPSPDVAIEGGTVMLLTPAGRVVADGAGTLRAGGLERLDLRVRPVRLRQGGVDLTLSSAALQARGVPAGITLQGAAEVGALAAPGLKLAGVALRLQADVATRGLAPLGPLSAKLDGSAATLATGGSTLRTAVVALDFDGGFEGPSDRLSVTGAGGGSLRAASLAGAVRATAPRLALQIRGLDVSRRGRDLRVRLGATGQASATEISSGAAFAAGPTLRFTLANLAAETVGGKLGLASGLDASLAARLATSGGRGLEGLRLTAHGPLRLEGERARFSGAVGGAGAADARTRRDLAQAAVVGPALAAAAKALKLSAPAVTLTAGPGTATLVAASPLTLEGPGARLAVQAVGSGPMASFEHGRLGGAARVAGRAAELDAALNLGRYDLAGGAGSANGTLTLAGSAGPVRDGKLDAAFSARQAGGATSLSLSRCATVSAAAVGEAARDVTGRICSAGSPLARLQARRWSAAGQLAELSLTAHAAHARLAGAATFDLAGDGGVPRSGRVVLERVAVSDLAPAKRFRPLTATGSATLAAAGWSGTAELAEAAKGRRLGKLSFTAAPTSRSGGARFDTAGLYFTQGGLQPTAITPLLPARQWSKVDGPLDLSLTAAWRDGRATTSAEVKTGGLDFTGPFGRVTGAKTDVRFSSLAPLATPPGQAFSADSVAWLTPLSDVRLRFQLQPEAVRVEAASARAAGGLVSLDATVVALKPDAPIAGVLRLSAVDLGKLIAASSLADKVKLDARLSGALPFSYGPQGLRLTDGKLAADGPGRLSLSRQALAGAAVQTSAMQDFAYQALENLAFDQLDATLGSLPKGRLGVLFHINGRHDPPIAQETRVGILDLLRGRAFDKPLPLPKGTPVNLTLDTSLNLDELLAAYRDMGAATPATSK